MEAQSLISFAQIALVAIFGLVCLNMYLVFRLKDIDPFAKWDPNQINGWGFIVFTIVGFAAAFISSAAWSDRFLLLNNPASEHGVEIDRMMWNTMYVSIAVVLITNPLMFFYAWRYRMRPGNKALYYPHNNKLELVWTIIPAIVLTVLVFDGAVVWTEVTNKAPQGAIEIELNGKQFGWTVRYPGSDLEFGETQVSFINEGKGNTLGFNMDDKRGHDDLVVQELVIPVNTDIELKIRSRDVLHSANLAHFRVKMDAVPGMITRFHFKPTITTADMRQRTQNENFEYEMNCQQICGGGHWNMRLVVKVVTMEEYKQWLASQKTFYAGWKSMNPDPVIAPEKAAEPAAPATAPAHEPAAEGHADAHEAKDGKISMN
ncbi:MAG: cytochrome c oxidase subunit II [Bacteroidetes bacterium]|jgi:cytochrome c oxidase subunit II|nr:MAG: cytochrome c oxidase subunit II [Bacteroidota bacterium]